MTFEFLITIVILIGGGLLLFKSQGSASFEAILALVSGVISSVATFWFSRRQVEKMEQVINNQDRGYLVDGTKKGTGGGPDYEKTN